MVEESTNHQKQNYGSYSERGKDRLHLFDEEITRCYNVISDRKYKQRDRLIFTLLLKHGFRAIELINLKWSDIDWQTQQMSVVRAKGGTNAMHPILGDTLRQLRAVRTWQGNPKGGYVISTTPPKLGQLTTRAVNKIIAEIGEAAGLEARLSPHQLRHTCGYMLAQKGIDTRTIQAYLGHTNIQHTVRYTALSSKQFERIFN